MGAVKIWLLSSFSGVSSVGTFSEESGEGGPGKSGCLGDDWTGQSLADPYSNSRSLHLKFFNIGLLNQLDQLSDLFDVHAGIILLAGC